MEDGPMNDGSRLLRGFPTNDESEFSLSLMLKSGRRRESAIGS
jgi:hypothetical protein